MTDISGVDLSPLEISVARHGTLHLRVTPPISAEPSLDDSKQLLCFESTEFDLLAFAPTREGLLAQVQEHLALLWQEYAMAPDDTLDGPALALKQRLLARLIEAAYAA